MMIDILEHYIYDSLPHEGNFITRPSLEYKVDSSGRILPFYGNTTVFLLHDDIKQQLAALQQQLYRHGTPMLADPLHPSTFHMTLHDLANSPKPSVELQEDMSYMEKQAKNLLRQWARRPNLKMRTTCMFNMVNTSIVLGLKPTDNDSWNQLDEMYCALESVRLLGYAMTPHITMAYFRPGNYDQSQIEALKKALSPIDMEIELHMKDLVCQNFYSMNHYETV